MNSLALKRGAVPLLILFVSCGFFLFSAQPSIWAVRNTLTYHAGRLLAGQDRIAPPASAGPSARMQGCVRNQEQAAVPDAHILLAAPDGTTFSTRSQADGCYLLDNLPAGRYVPVVGAEGYDSLALRSWGQPLSLSANSTFQQDIILPPISLPDLQGGRDLRFGEPITRTWDLPVPSVAVEQELRFESAGRPNQLSLLYRPITTTERLPLLLAIYPGPADTWWPVSIPLASAGYAVLAVGPSYALDLEPDIDELQRVINFARAGRLPGVDGSRITLLGGSYSSLHVLRILQRDVAFDGAVLLGPPSDLFDMRRRFEEGSIFPPFGLDQALIALGTPDRSPEVYWRYSAAYHLRGDMPPILLMHSMVDEIVPYQQSEILTAALEEAGVQHDTYFFEGMKHYLLATESSEELSKMYDLTLDFLQRVQRSN
jgi:hypothetical protein